MTVATELQEIAEKIETKMATVVTVVEKVQARQDELEKQAKDTQVGIDDESKGQLKEAGENATAALAAVNELKTTSEGIVKAQEFIEKSIARLGDRSGADKGQLSEEESKAKDEMVNYLRHRQPISEETNQLIGKALMEKTLHGVDENRLATEVKTLIAGSNPDGGYFIRPTLSSDMIRRIFETSPMRTIANMATSTSDTFEIIIDDNEADSGGWVGEVQTRGDTDTPEIGKLTIPIHEQFAQPVATQKMLDDAGFNIEAWLSGKVTDRLTRDENTAFVRGDGSQKPRGFITIPDWATPEVYERGALERIDSGVNASFDADTIIAMQNLLKEAYQARAIFGIKRTSFTNILTLKDSQGQYLINSMILREGADKVLLGKPVVFMDDLDGLVTNGQSLVYGDFNVGYTIVDRIGFRVIRDNVTKKGFVKFYTTKRTGGDVTNYESIKIMRLRA